MESLLDIHVHGEPMISEVPRVKRILKEKASPLAKCWERATTEALLNHIKKDNLDTIYVIYRNPKTIVRLQEKNNTKCQIRGMFYIKNIFQPPADRVRELYQEGLVQGIKLHPVLDYYELTSENLKKVLILARELKIPILFHTDDRKEFMELTAPNKVSNLIRGNPDINFIIGHGGAYAHPRIFGSSLSVRNYWLGKRAPYSRIDLIVYALFMACYYGNAYHDLSVCTNRIKARLIVGFLGLFPETASKILVGSDFPLNNSSAQTQIKALKKAGLSDFLLEKIIKNRPFKNR